MDKKTYIRDSAHDHRKAGVDNGDYDPWFYETCKLVNIACDKFWTQTAERARLNELYYKSRWGRI